MLIQTVSFTMLLAIGCLLPIVLGLPAVRKQVRAQVRDSFCPDGALESPTNRLCFKFVNSHKNFFDAEDDCVSLGGHLAVVDSLYTNNFIAGGLVLNFIYRSPYSRTC